MNLRKAQKKFKKLFVDEGHDPKGAGIVFNKFYKETLKETRTEVLNYFKFFDEKNESNISFKDMLRMYPFYRSPYHPERKMYDKLNDDVNNLIRKIQVLGSIDELLEDNHPLAITSPVDRVIDFAHLLNEKKTKFEIPQKTQTKSTSQERNTKTINKFKEEYDD